MKGPSPAIPFDRGGAARFMPWLVAREPMFRVSVGVPGCKSARIRDNASGPQRKARSGKFCMSQ